MVLYQRHWLLAGKPSEHAAEHKPAAKAYSFFQPIGRFHDSPSALPGILTGSLAHSPDQESESDVVHVAVLRGQDAPSHGPVVELDIEYVRAVGSNPDK